MQEQVASGRLACAGFALSPQAYDRTMAHPGRNGHIEGFWARHHTRATTRRAGLLLLHAATVADRAHGRGVECDRASGSVVRLFEAECNGRLDVLTTHGKARARTRAAPGAKQRRKKVAEAARAAPGTEEVTHIVDINALAFPAGWGGELSAGLPVRPELIVAFTLLRIGEDVIGLPDILKFLFRGCVVRVDVGMILTRQLAIGFFYVARSRGARHTEDFVVILELDSHG